MPHKTITTNEPAIIAKLSHVLMRAKLKLKLYREQHSGEYIGGQEYGALVDNIEEALRLAGYHD